MIKIFLLSACLSAIVLSIFASGLCKPLGHDENMYCTGAALIAQGRMIYRDFSYVAHPPYHALLLAGVYKLFNTDYYLLAGRLVSLICDCLTALIIFLVYRRVFRPFPAEGIYLGLAAVVVWVFNPYVNYASGLAWNHSVIMLAAAASFWLYTDIDSKRYLRIAAIALLLTFATFSRLTTAVIWLLFFVFILLCQGPKLRAACVFVLASLFAAILPLYIIALAPKAFYINIFVIPLLNGRYLHSISMAFGKLDMVRAVLGEPAYAITALIGVSLWLFAFINRKGLGKPEGRNMLLAAFIAMAFFIIAFIPATVWHQYFAMPVAFLVISLAWPLWQIAVARYRRLINLAAAAVIMVAIMLNPLPLAAIVRATSVSNWTGVRLHSISADIAERIGKDNRILTLAPLFAIEGGCRIYPELSAGPFVYRVASLMTEEQRETAKVAGPEQIEQLIKENPSDAVFLGTEPPTLEEPLYKIAGPDWKKQTYADGRLRLLFRVN